MKAILSIGTIALVCIAQTARLAGCETIVRDAAFRGPRDVHQLCVIAAAKDAAADKITADLKAWLDGPGGSLNVQLVHIDADDPKVDWLSYGIPSAPPALPVTVLIGRHSDTREAFVIDHWEPGPTAAELEVLRTSPVREEIQKHVGGALAVLLYAPAQSDGSGAPAAKSEHVALLQKRVEQSHKTGTPGLALVRLDRSDPRERILAGFADLRPDGPDWLGIVFGRGKLLTPPLTGSELASGELDGLLDQLTEHCSCTRPLESMGVDIPLAWNNALDARVVTIGHAADEERLLAAQRVLPSVASEMDERANSAGEVNAAGEGGASGTGRLVATTIWALCGLAAAVVIGSAILLRR